MILYHFTHSPYARRVRLALALKGVMAELRDVRISPEHMEDVRRLNPMHTVPVLVDGEFVIGDSTAILHYLDRKWPEPALWPSGLDGARAFQLSELCDGAIDTLANVGIRFDPLHDHAAFPMVEQLLIGRVQRALEQLASEVASHRAPQPYLCGPMWSAADIAVFTLVEWLEGLPRRAASNPTPAKLVALGWALPAALSTWAAQHAQRPDVIGLT